MQGSTKGQPLSYTTNLNFQTGTTYQFVFSDGFNATVLFNNANPITATIPDEATVPYPVGSRIDLVQQGIGKLTIAAMPGVTINSFLNKKSAAGQYIGLSIIKYAANSWFLVGYLIT